MGNALFLILAFLGWHFNGAAGIVVATLGLAVLAGTFAYALKGKKTDLINEWTTLASQAAADIGAIRSDFNAIRDVIVSVPSQEWRDIKNVLAHNPNITLKNLDTSRREVLAHYHATGRLPKSDMDMLSMAMEAQREILSS